MSASPDSDISVDTDSEPEVEQPPSLDLGISKAEVEVNDRRLGVLLDPTGRTLTSGADKYMPQKQINLH